MMNYEDVLDFMKKIQEEGYAIAIFTPAELEGVDPRNVEPEMIRAGFDQINYLSEE